MEPMNAYLELANMGIHPMRYGRIVATSQAELLAFAPEQPYVWGFVRGSSERWIWDGAAWQRAGVIPYPSAQYPDIASLPVGAVVIEGGAVKKCRYVAELNGPDTLTLLPPSDDLRNNDWEVSFLFCDKALDGSLPSILLDGFSGASRVLSAVILANGGTISFTLRDGTNAVAAIGVNANFGDGKYHRFTMRKSGLTFYVSTDLTSEQSVAIPVTWSGLGYTSFRLSDSTISLRPLQFANYKAKLNGTDLDVIPCEETSGATLANSATPARPATLSDATAHAKALLPISVL